MQDSIFVGLDVHKATILVAHAGERRGSEVVPWGTIRHRADQIRKLAGTLGGTSPLQYCYEAEPCGYGLHRQGVELGHDCTDDPVHS